MFERFIAFNLVSLYQSLRGNCSKYKNLFPDKCKLENITFLRQVGTLKPWKHLSTLYSSEQHETAEERQ